jgi:hypothetical protein
VALGLLVMFAAGCATSSVGARPIPGREADRRLAANVLATGEPSAWSLQTLHRNVLLEAYREDRVEALTRLHAKLEDAGLGRARMRELLFALSELSFDHGRRGGERMWFLASAVYAYGFLSSDAGYSTEALALEVDEAELNWEASA